MSSPSLAPGAEAGLDPRAAVLVAARLAGVAPVEVLVARTGLEPRDVEAEAEAAVGDGELRATSDGRWSPTPAGRRAGEAALAAALVADGATAAVEAGYEGLRGCNDELLAIVSDWQLRTGDGRPVPNDHADAAHDEAVLERLVALHRRAVGDLSPLTAAPGFAGYLPRLEIALARARSGAVDYVARPTVDSYHQVWFELHEHLLAALGVERATEGQER